MVPETTVHLSFILFISMQCFSLKVMQNPTWVLTSAAPFFTKADEQNTPLHLFHPPWIPTLCLCETLQTSYKKTSPTWIFPEFKLLSYAQHVQLWHSVRAQGQSQVNGVRKITILRGLVLVVPSFSYQMERGILSNHCTEVLKTPEGSTARCTAGSLQMPQDFTLEVCSHFW